MVISLVFGVKRRSLRNKSRQRFQRRRNRDLTCAIQWSRCKLADVLTNELLATPAGIRTLVDIALRDQEATGSGLGKKNRKWKKIGDDMHVKDLKVVVKFRYINGILIGDLRPLLTSPHVHRL